MNMELIYVLGAGGIGCVLGYALRAAGARVTFVDADAAKIAWGREHGIRVDQLPSYPAEFLHFSEWTPAAGSTVLLCTKCYHNEDVLKRWHEAGAPPITLLPVQNGFDHALEAQGHGWEGIASFISECLPQRSHTRITRAGHLHLGRRAASDSEEPEVFGPLRAGLRALPRVRLREVPDILPYKYSKLMYNAAISPLAAAAGLDNGDLLMLPPARRLFFAQLRENYDILHGGGFPLARIGLFHPDTVQRILRSQLLSRSLAWAFYPTLHKSYCSMFGDLPKGRTEIDFYNRHLIDLAGDRPCPRNRRVYALIKRMERERLAPGLKWLDELTVE